MNAGYRRVALLPQGRSRLRGRLLSASREQALDEKGDLPPSSRFGHIDGFPLRCRALVGNFHHGAVDNNEVRLGVHGPLKTRKGERHPIERELPGTWGFPPLRETTTFPGSLSLPSFGSLAVRAAP